MLPLALLLLLPPGRSAGAEPAVAERVIAAADAGDAAALDRLATEGGDAWLVVDALFARGRLDAARAFSARLQGAAHERLPAYVDSLANVDIDTAAREALAKPGAPPEGLPMCPVSEVRVHERRGALLNAARKPAEAQGHFALGAARAEEIGWLARALDLRRGALVSAQMAGDMQRGLDEAEALARVSGALGDEVQRLRALQAVAAFKGEIPGRQREAIEDARALLPLLMEESREHKEMRSKVLSNMGQLEVGLRLLDDARAHIGESLAIKEGLGDRRNIPASLMALGSVERVSGNYAEAVTLYERALTLAREEAERLAATDRIEAGRLLQGASIIAYNLGEMHRQAGRYGPAIDALEASIEVAERIGDLRTIGDALRERGYVERILGRYDRAREAYAKALPLYQRLRRPPEMAMIHHAIATSLIFEERYAEAIAPLEECIRLCDESNEPVGGAMARASLASSLVYLGRREPAARLLDDAITAFEAAGRPAPPILHAELLINRSVLRLGNGDEAGAEADIESGMALLDPLFRPDIAALGWQTRARLRLQQGRHADALHDAREALSILDAGQRGLADQEAAGARERWRNLYALGMEAALAAGSAGDLLWFMERKNGQILASTLGSREEVLKGRVPPELQEAEARARLRVSDALATLRRATARGERAPITEGRRAFEAARKALEDAILNVQRSARALADVGFAEPVTLDALQSRLGADEALVLIALTDERAFALRVLRDGAAIVPLGERAPLIAAAQRFAPDEGAGDPQPALADLRRLLIEPLALPESVRRLMLGPPGPLSHVPFSAIAHERVVSFLPSATTWIVLRDGGSAAGEGVLGVGDPLHEGLPALPATRGEVETVADVRLLGEEANERRVREEIGKRPRWRAVHFACHGRIDVDRPQLSCLALTPGDGSDGLLTVAEVSATTIPADLAVLSACETARGRVYEAEGVLGLARAFMIAGTPRVLCSQWKVDDAATKALMVRFYELWNKGLDPADALRRAQAHVREHPEWSHPRYWAAWALWGLGR